jgi:hypothetical protein
MGKPQRSPRIERSRQRCAGGRHMVDAALAGLDQGELVTIPPRFDGDEWNRFEAARRALPAVRQFRSGAPIPGRRTYSAAGVMQARCIRTLLGRSTRRALSNLTESQCQKRNRRSKS